MNILLAYLNALGPKMGVVCPHKSALAPGARWPWPLGLLLGFQHNEQLLLLTSGWVWQSLLLPGVTRNCLGPSFGECIKGAVEKGEALRQAR